MSNGSGVAWKARELRFRSPGRPHWRSSKGCQGKASQEKLRVGVQVRRAIQAERAACTKVGKGLASSGNRQKGKQLSFKGKWWEMS